jgi:hypothetical protein
MKIIKIIPSKRFRGYWAAWECDGVEPVYEKQQQAIDYAVDCRFGGFPEGEVHVYDDAGKNILRVLKIKGGSIEHPGANIVSGEST